MAFLDKHKAIETHATLLMVLSLLVVTIGGIVQIVPLFYLENTIEKVEGMRPYTPLELAGRSIYVREGCYGCHSQMIRPMRDEVERYGHYSLAAESMYDRPFQWGSKRTGPDLARVGGRYSDEWHQDHFTNAKSVVPESVMPPYGFLANNVIDGKYIQDVVSTNRMAGVPTPTRWWKTRWPTLPRRLTRTATARASRLAMAPMPSERRSTSATSTASPS